MTQQYPGNPPPSLPSFLPLSHLRAWRLYQQLTQVELSLRTVAPGSTETPIDTTTIRRIEKGKPAAAATVLRLARALNISVRDLRDTDPTEHVPPATPA